MRATERTPSAELCYGGRREHDVVHVHVLMRLCSCDLLKIRGPRQMCKLSKRHTHHAACVARLSCLKDINDTTTSNNPPTAAAVITAAGCPFEPNASNMITQRLLRGSVVWFRVSRAR
eukprot:TRINITY_DN5109_c0_g1_i1.p1 TRINITY_DN5109_c0_g1~~TRINITY_DN5109_c0_g1_i1.p1  ORF type:complete len:118 (+),score=0.88 TRINITY_DN5109_c0_g1_i1:1173-1526(+)